MIRIVDSHISFDGSRSEIEDLASSFHQGFGYMGETPNECAQDIFDSLSTKQKASLRSSLIELINEYPGKKQKGLIKAWRRLGAAWWDPKIDLRATIRKWIIFLEQSC